MDGMIDEKRYSAALLAHIGFEKVQSLDAAGASVVRFLARPEFTHSAGTTVQGGIITAWLDCGMAWAVTARDATRGVASLEIKVSFIARVGQGAYEVRSRVTKWGRSVVFLEAELLDDAGKLMAKASSTGMLV